MALIVVTCLFHKCRLHSKLWALSARKCNNLSIEIGSPRFLNYSRAIAQFSLLLLTNMIIFNKITPMIRAS